MRGQASHEWDDERFGEDGSEIRGSREKIAFSHLNLDDVSDDVIAYKPPNMLKSSRIAMKLLGSSHNTITMI